MNYRNNRWEKHYAYRPRKSITGRWIIGPMYRYQWQGKKIAPTVLPKIYFKYAKNKEEIFLAKLKGIA